MRFASIIHSASLCRCLVVWLLCCCGPHATTCKSAGHSSSRAGNARAIMLRAKSAEMHNYMRPDVDACEDFYKYACGNWAKINPAYSDLKTGIFSVLAKSYNRRVERLLGEPKRSGDGDMERKVKYFFESCLQREEVRHSYREKLLSVLEEFGGMPALKRHTWRPDEFDWLTVVGRILHRYGKRILIGVEINADLTNNEVNRLYIGQWDDLVPGQTSAFYVHLRIVWQMELSKVLGLSAEQASALAAQMAEFVQKLAAGMADPNEGLGMEDKTRLRLLDEMSESYGAMLNLTHFVRTWLGHDYRLPVYEYVDRYLRNLRQLILETPRDVLANYIMWELLQDFRLEAEESDEKQRLKCVEATKRYFFKYLDHMVYQDMLRRHPDIGNEVQRLWQHIKEAFEETLKGPNSAWLSEQTRDKALEKLSAMTLEVNGYEGMDFRREFGALSISTAHYFENVVNILELRGHNYRLKLLEPPRLDNNDLLSLTPAYVAEYNKVIMPVIFLQPHYLWDKVYPAALKYGTVGYIVAHELAHGFDDTIRKYDAKGNLNNWWDRDASAEFAARKECLRQQYGTFKLVSRPYSQTQAQGENIADNVGIRIAYAAYKRWLAQHEDADSEHLPHLPSHTPQQLFFISAAQLWCTDVNHTWRRILFATDVHPPEEVRVRVMLANFDAFATTFQCRQDTRMHPRHKCVMY